MANKILVVDDEPNIVLSLEFLMKQAGFQVRTAADGEAALAAIAAETTRPGVARCDDAAQEWL
jgi:DNA-binding response OmpR family regulator